jgi:hypothetical protein
MLAYGAIAMFGSRRGGLLLALALGVNACFDPTGDEAPVYDLAYVDEASVPVILDSSSFDIGGRVYLWLLAGGLVLRSDSTTTWTSWVRLQGALTDTAWVNRYERTYRVWDDSIEITDTAVSAPRASVRGTYSGSQIVLPAAFDGPPGGGRRYRYIRR